MFLIGNKVQDLTDRDTGEVDLFTGGVFLRNYLDHKDEVKYVDGLLANSQEWNWFIEME